MSEQYHNNKWRDHKKVVAQRLQQRNRELALETLRRQQMTAF